MCVQENDGPRLIHVTHLRKVRHPRDANE
jgi:hypothetical protein